MSDKITLALRLRDEKVESNVERTVVFNSKEKSQYDIVLNQESKVIDLSFIDNARMLFFSGDAPFQVSMTVLGQEIVYPVQDVFFFSVTPEFMDDVSEIKITNIDPIDVVVKMRAFGEDLLTDLTPPTITIDTEDTAPYPSGSEQTISVFQEQDMTDDGNRIFTRYTTDGTDPSRTEGIVVGEDGTDFIITEDTTVKAVSYAVGYELSEITEVTYEFAI